MPPPEQGHEKRGRTVRRRHQEEGALDTEAGKEQEGAGQGARHSPDRVEEGQEPGRPRPVSLALQGDARQGEDRSGRDGHGQHELGSELQDGKGILQVGPVEPLDRGPEPRVGRDEQDSGGEEDGREVQLRGFPGTSQQGDGKSSDRDAEEDHGEHQGEGETRAGHEEQQETEPEDLEREKERPGQGRDRQESDRGPPEDCGRRGRRPGIDALRGSLKQAPFSRSSCERPRYRSGDSVQEAGHQRGASYAQGPDEEDFGRDRPGDGPQGVPAVQAPESAPEADVAPRRRAHQHGKSRPHRRGRDQKQQERRQEPEEIEEGRRLRERLEDGPEGPVEDREEEDEAHPEDADDRLGCRVEAKGRGQPPRKPDGEEAAERQAPHEAGEDEGRGRDAVSEEDARLAEPENFEDESRRAGAGEREAKEPGPPAAQLRPLIHQALLFTRRALAVR